MRNDNGFYLYGWQLDSSGNLPNGAASFGSLTPINLNSIQSTPLPTSRATLAFNLDARQAATDMHTLPGGPFDLPASGTASHFSRSQTIYDSQSNAREIRYEFRKVVGPMAHFTSNTGQALDLDDAFIQADGKTPNISAGDSFQIAVSGGATETYTFVDAATGDDIANNQIATVNGLLQAIAAHGSGSELEARIAESGRLLVQAKNPTVTISLSETSGAPLSGGSTLNIINDPDAPGDYTFEPEMDVTTNGVANPNQLDFPTIANTTDPQTQNWWEVTILGPDPNDPVNGAFVELSRGMLNFNGNGTLNATPDANGEYIISLPNVDFDASTTTDNISMDIDISGFRSFSAANTVFTDDQNGADIGLLSSVSVTPEGYISGAFTNGLTVNLYQIPLVMFQSPNSLDNIDGTAFSVSTGSGDPVLTLPGNNGSGLLAPSTIEGSNVELSDEFAKLIVTQRSFSANSKVITTVDEMTSNLARLKG
jgi:flagellar hook protein FlgE